MKTPVQRIDELEKTVANQKKQIALINKQMINRDTLRDAAFDKAVLEIIIETVSREFTEKLYGKGL